MILLLKTLKIQNFDEAILILFFVSQKTLVMATILFISDIKKNHKLRGYAYMVFRFFQDKF